MAVAFDGEAVSTNTVADGGSVSTNHTSAGANRYALAALAFTSGVSVSSATYGGVSMGSPLVTVLNVPDDLRVSIYGFPAPPTGSTAVAIAFSGNTYAQLAVMSFNGVDQGTPTSDTDTLTGNGGGPTVSRTLTAADDEMLVDALFHQDGGGVTAGADQTDRGPVTNVFNLTLEISTQPGTADDVMSWGLPGGEWAYVALSLKAATGGAGRTTKNTRSAPLGVEIGMSWRMNRVRRGGERYAMNRSRIYVPERCAA